MHQFVRLSLLCLLLSGCNGAAAPDAQQTRRDQDTAGFNTEPVTIDQACAAGAPAELAPVCELLGTATKSLSDACEGVSTAEACATFGGNVYGLVAACYGHGEEPFGSDARRVCKIADTFVAAAASYCRQTGVVAAEFCALFSSELIAQRMIERYEESTLHQAHQLQRELSADLPLVHTLYPATHNSFNATEANLPPTLSGSDANQRYVIADQLRMDIRGIEIDVHWMPSLIDGGFRATVCHGNAMHAGCTMEKSLRDELTELRRWLDANPREVIIIDLENNMGEALDGFTGANRYAQAAADIWATIGDRLFLPGTNTPRPCGEGQPLDVSVNQLRELGKQIIIYGACEYVHEGQSLMFDRSGTHMQLGSGSYFEIQAPDHCIYTLDEIDRNWVRFYEDGTMVGALSGAERQARVDEVAGMAQCGINMPSIDHLLPFDGRLQAMLWSWGEDEPSQPLANSVVIHRADGHFATVNSAEAPMAQACLNAGEPVIKDGQLNASRWLIASGTCPDSAEFAAPRHGLDNESLKLAKSLAGIDAVRLHF